MKNIKGIHFLFIQLGCSKNRVDGERMISSLIDSGAIPVDTEEKADVIIINTCGFIEDAKTEAIGEILNAVESGKKVIVAGCLAQRYKEEIMENIPEVDAVVGIFDTDKITDAVYEAVKGKKSTWYETKKLSPSCASERTLTTPFYYSYLKIADGCSNGCSYCTIPKIRGKFVSEPMEKVIQEAKWLSENSVTEIIVIAQDTSRYGLDLYKEKKLPELIRELDKTEFIKWIRIHYLYPEAITDELLTEIKNSKKVLPYFDIPIQHINNRILSLMNRKTTKEEIISLLKKIKKMMPQSVIRTSLISGFPSETEEEHKELVEFVKESYFDRLGVFPYSTEEGTKASKIKGKLSKKIKNARAAEIMAVQSEVSLLKNKEKIGKIFEVLVEGYDTINDVYFGRTYMDSPEIDGTVYFKANTKTDIGEYINVRITDCDSYDLIGETV